MERTEELSMDETFLRKLEEAVFENLQNEQFGVEELASIAGLSRSQLHRRLNKVNGKSVTHFIREIRLEEAHRLLEKEVGTVSEIAYRVGFSSPTYFNTCFHEHFGYTPGEVKKKKGEAGNREISRKTNKKSISSGYGIRIIGGVFFLLGALLLIWIFFIGKQQPVGDTANNYSIAILPIRSLSSDPDQQYLADGVMDAITAYLSKIRDLRIIPRTSVEQYKEGEKNFRKEAGKLNIDYLLEGSFQFFRDSARLTMRLINTNDGSQLWAQTFDREWADILAVQSEVAQTIASEIKLVLTPEQQADIESIPTNNHIAYGYYLRGNDYFNRCSCEPDLRYAVQMYKKAIELDSGFTLAWAGLATSSRALYWAYYDRSNEHLQKTTEYLNKAMTLEPNRLEVKLVEARYYYQCKGEFDKSLKILDRLKSRYPKNADILFLMADVFSRKGAFDKALSLYDQALRLNPVNWRYWNDYAITLHFLGRYDEAERCYKKAIEINPPFPNLEMYHPLVDLYYSEGDMDKLNELLNNPGIPMDPGYIRIQKALINGDYLDAIELIDSSPDSLHYGTAHFFSKHLTMALLYSAIPDEHMARLHFEKERIYLEDKLKESVNDDRVHRSLGLVYAGLGNRSKALEHGQKSIEIRSKIPDVIGKNIAESWMIRILLMVGDYDEGISRLKNLLKHNKYVSVGMIKYYYWWRPYHRNEKFRQFISDSQ